MNALRAEIVAGRLRGAALLDRLLAVPFRERDAWIDDVLGFEPPPPDGPELPRGAVPYLPCGVDDIVTMTRELAIGPADQLVDIGAGVGRVAIIVHLLTGARAHGIEIQLPLVASARARSASLGLGDVTFEHGNAADLPLDGSIFFLYAPCNGELLTRVGQRIEGVARRRSIVVCAVDLELDVAWLVPRPAASRALTIYDSVAAGVRR